MEAEGYEIGKKMMFYTFYVLIVALVLIAMVFIFRKYSLSPLETNPLVYVDVYVERFMGSPDCFAYKDSETGNVYSGMIDKSKFTADVLNKCYKKNIESPFEFSLTLVDQGKETTIETEEYSVLQRKTPLFVLINDKGEIRKGTLVVGIEGIK